MSKFFEYEGTKDAIIYNTSDWHVGSKAFHEDAARELMQMVVDDDAWLTFGGDQIEGKPTRSNHFDPKSLVRGLETIEDQARYFADLVEPVANHILCVGVGNHELYLLPDLDITAVICEMIGRPDIAGHYQNWVKYGDVTMHHWHGRPTMPRGAKDPIQREANQKAWLKNKMEGLAGSADVHYMSHTHHCLIVEPQKMSTLLNDGVNVRRKTFTPEKTKIGDRDWMPKEARWYVNTGTLRRGGGFDHMDYSEVAGYTTPEIACTRTEIKDGKVKNITKVLF
jgi:hypothetical protein